MSRRNAATLVEVLVAIFVTAIGLLSLLALFPIGALSMAQAIRDSRSAVAAQNAAAVREVLDIDNDSRLHWGLDYPQLSVGPQQLFRLGVPPPPLIFPPSNILYPPNPDGPSYPVMVDPIGMRGWAIASADSRFGVRDRLCAGIERIDPSVIAALPSVYQYKHALRWFTLGDDLTFDEEYGGFPSTRSGALAREGKYSFAYLLKRERGGKMNAATIVYGQRPLQALQASAEKAYRAIYFPFNADATPRNLVWVTTRPGVTGLPDDELPNIRRGSWILDATMELTPGIPNTTTPYFGSIHGNFYRVVESREIVIPQLPLVPGIPAVLRGTTALELELERNLRGFTAPPSGIPIDAPQPLDPASWTNVRIPVPIPPGVAVVMESAIEVIDHAPRD